MTHGFHELGTYLLSLQVRQEEYDLEKWNTLDSIDPALHLDEHRHILVQRNPRERAQNLGTISNRLARR